MADAAQTEKYNASLFLADKLIRRGDHADAVTVLVPWADAPLEPFHHAVLGYNLAQVFAQMGQAIEALAWFDWGIDAERGVGRTFVAEGKAAYLFEQGRRDEAEALWRELLASGRLDDKGHANVENNLRVAAERR
jgi:tetratricopeptide (TPR) repeat protein